MASPGAYFRPGLSVVCVARGESTTPVALRAFLAATTPHVEQLCLVVDSRELLDPALAAGPKLRCRLVPVDASAAQAWLAAAHLADHEWSFQLLPDELLQGPDFDRLRHVLPHAGPRVVTIADDRGQQAQVRLWRTGWNLAPDATGDVVPAGPATSRPTGAVDLAWIAPRAVEEALSLRTPPVAQRGPALVCGMHRSGTSSVTRILNLLGVSLGSALAGVHTAADASNPKGHWEDLGGRTVHAGILRVAVGLRTEWEWLHDVAVSGQLISATNLQALAELASKLAARGRWGIKDPRISLLLPAWHQVVPDACMVVCVRDPLSVARSLRTRDALPLVDGLRLWRAYNRRLLESTYAMRARVLVVSYEQLLSDLGPQTERIARFLGLPDGAAGDRRSEIAEFVDRGLRHHATAGDLRAELDRALSSLAVEGEADALLALYKELQGLANLAVETGPQRVRRAATRAARPATARENRHEPKLSVVMPYYENRRTLQACLESFCDQRTDPADYEIVIVDDGSSTPARPVVEAGAWPVRVRLADGRGNRGQSAATNTGILLAQAPIVLLTCADILAHEDLVGVHLREHTAAACRVAIGGSIPYAEHLEITPFLEYLAGDGPQFAFGLIKDPDHMPPQFCYAPNFSARKQDLLDCGLFDERFRYGFQDTDLGLRLSRSGVRLLYRAQAIAHHDHPNDLTAFCMRQRCVAAGYWIMAEKHPDALKAEAAHQALARDLPRLPPLQVLIDAAKRIEHAAAADPAVRYRSKRDLHRRYQLALHRAFLEGLRQERHGEAQHSQARPSAAAERA